jgi:hypothetical protein
MHLNYLCHWYTLAMQCRVEIPSFMEKWRGRHFWTITVLDTVYILALALEFLDSL